MFLGGGVYMRGVSEGWWSSSRSNKKTMFHTWFQMGYFKFLPKPSILYQQICCFVFYTNKKLTTRLPWAAQACGWYHGFLMSSLFKSKPRQKTLSELRKQLFKDFFEAGHFTCYICGFECDNTTVYKGRDHQV